FVNNIVGDCLWINISPNVRCRLLSIDISDDLAVLGDIGKKFPVGSALRVTATGVDVEKNRLDLTAKQGGSSTKLAITDFSTGMILLGRVTKASERQVLVQLSDTTVGAISLIDMADDYSTVNPTNYHRDDILRVCVVQVDIPNKKISLSIRPSKVLSSSLPVRDPEILSITQLKV